MRKFRNPVLTQIRDNIKMNVALIKTGPEENESYVNIRLRRQTRMLLLTYGLLRGLKLEQMEAKRKEGKWHPGEWEFNQVYTPLKVKFEEEQAKLEAEVKND